MMIRTFTVELQITAPATVGENEIETAINAMLDEPPADWGEWTVGAAYITHVVKEEVER